MHAASYPLPVLMQVSPAGCLSFPARWYIHHHYIIVCGVSAYRFAVNTCTQNSHVNAVWCANGECSIFVCSVYDTTSVASDVQSQRRSLHVLSHCTVHWQYDHIWRNLYIYCERHTLKQKGKPLITLHMHKKYRLCTLQCSWFLNWMEAMHQVSFICFPFQACTAVPCQTPCSASYLSGDPMHGPLWWHQQHPALTRPKLQFVANEPCVSN